MRRKHVEIRIVGVTFVIAVVVIIALYLRTNSGAKRSGNPVAAKDLSGQTAASQPTQTSSQAAQPTLNRTQTQSEPQTETQGQTTAPQLTNTKIVTVGDSFTYGNPVGPGYSWPKWIADHLGVPVTNQGKVGQTSQDVLAHFSQDVVAAKPGRVIIFVGDGDVIKRVSETDSQNAIKTMVARARAHHIIPILALPLPYPGFQLSIKTLRDWISHYAKEEKLQTLDFATVLFNSKGEYLKGMSSDGKYPSLQGYEAMGKYAVGVLGQSEGMNVRGSAGIR
ncbi:GDSL-like Lipase/Acylhydrolase family [Acididesulfobacillus acetoxydans]|uniref:GDSL-like Lipase/Acylhydrolase family n=1 Tax=Acididesulfobacillus acetoxydans TaxID=1561005 RepID=A0A8S0WA47_9FIRM|nr:GDSL-type esterase/lipase family protein [Acididesulfobacillus acetoxydans]CAA7603129.1 GDSL-like Lipase/Acylhydrolase family [Acididesulfobacillus acetoxydans]CEJ05633.1 Lysophospholipase L1-like esterase [Acididesulfobacillus acetoxydans]